MSCVRIFGMCLATLIVAPSAQAQLVPPPIDYEPTSGPNTYPDCTGASQDPRGGTFCVGATATNFRYNATLSFLPPDVTLQQSQEYLTRIQGRIDGGSPLFDQSYTLPFSDAAVQAGVTAARAAITSQGGPGIIVTGPTLINRSVNTQAVTGPSTYRLAGDNTTITVQTYIGGVTPPVIDYASPAQKATIIQLGDLTGCSAAADQLFASGGSSTRPSCTPAPEERAVEQGFTSVTSTLEGEYLISETRTDTLVQTISETYELLGRVLPVGAVHGALKSASFDLAGRLLKRLPEVETNLWLEGYAMRVRHGGLRHSRGLAGGVSLGLAPGLRLVLGVDHGSSDIDSSQDEAADLQLTEIGGALKLERGAFTGSLSAVYGVGSARSFRNLIGSSSGSYDLRLAGAAIDLGYQLPLGEGWSLGPLAGVDHIRLHSDGFRESGTLGLIAKSHSSHRTRALAGIEISHRHGGTSLSASARYVALLDGARRTLPVAFALAPDVHLVSRAPKEPNTAQLGARASIELVPGGNLRLGYDARLGRHYKSHHGFLAFAANW